jgi:MscS family membrane protein
MHNSLSLFSRFGSFTLFGLCLGTAAYFVPRGAQSPKPAELRAPASEAPAAPVGKEKPKAAPAAKEKSKEIPLADRLRSPYEADRPLADKLRAPRETLRTLYFAAMLYDLFPKIVDDAIACLDLDAMQPRPAPQDAALLALDLEQVLQNLALPLSGVPDEGAGERCILYDANGLKLALRRSAEGGWRFDAETIAQLPALRRAARERPRQRGDTTALREGFTDPRATLRQFVSDYANGDYYAAARALDLSALSDEQRREQGPALAHQLAFVQQRRAFFFRQEVPDQPDGPAYTWHADGSGRLTLERIRQPDGKDAWLFTRQTVRNIPKMYAAAKELPPDDRYVRMGMVVPALEAHSGQAVCKRPDDIPIHLGSPRALLQGFFRVMDAADTNDARLADALEYLDLAEVPLADRAPLGTKLASKLEAVLRKLPLDLRSLPDTWNAPPQLLGEAQGVRVEIQRQRDGCWRFSKATVSRIPEMFDKLAGKTRHDSGHGTQLDSARDTVVTFLAATRRRNFDLAARCLNLSEIHASAQEELGPVLAFKLKFILDRIGRIYIQEIPDQPEGPRYVLYRGDLGRLTLERRTDEAEKGAWQFTPGSVLRIEPMFLAMHLAPEEAAAEDAPEGLTEPSFWDTPGPWLRLWVPDWLEIRVGALELYQWFGLLLGGLLSWLGARLAMRGVIRLLTWLLRRSGSELSGSFLTTSLRPFTWLTAVWIFFLLLGVLDLPISVAAAAFAAQKFLLAALVGWLGVRLIDLSMAIYTNSELLRPHRSLSDMIVPVSMRLGKSLVVLVVAVYSIYQVGQIDLLGKFLTGLGVAGLAASLAAQDALKSFFGTLLLISERAFKIGDKIQVSGKEGVVEQVGFRSTRLRTGDGSLLTVPNSIIAAAPIDNLGVPVHHRYRTTIEISPVTPAGRLLEFRDQLQAWLLEQAVVLREQMDLHIHQISQRGIELNVNLLLQPHTKDDETRFREAITCEILHLAAALDVVLTPQMARQEDLKTAVHAA